MTIDKPDMLLWMDVETTGLDPDHDRILEVEMRCTDMKGVLCVGGFHRMIGLAERNVSITDENFKAWRMHCANGLLEDAFDAGYTEAATANGLEEYVDSLAQSFTLHPPAATRSSTSTSSAASARTSRCTTTASTWPPSATVSKPPDGTWGRKRRRLRPAPTAPAHASTVTSANTRASSATSPPIRSDTSPRKQQGDGHRSSDPPMRRHPDRLDGQQAMSRTKPTMKGTSE